jgi:hypothetical protein
MYTDRYSTKTTDTAYLERHALQGGAKIVMVSITVPWLLLVDIPGVSTSKKKILKPTQLLPLQPPSQPVPTVPGPALGLFLQDLSRQKVRWDGPLQLPAVACRCWLTRRPK